MEFPAYLSCKILLIIILVLLHITNSVEFESFLELPKSGPSENRIPTRGGSNVYHVASYGAVGDGLHDDTQV